MSGRTSRKYPQFTRGVLETSGLSEVSYFLRRAMQQVGHAKFTLDHTDFSDSIKALSALGPKVDLMSKLISDIQDDLVFIETDLARAVEAREDSEEEEAARTE